MGDGADCDTVYACLCDGFDGRSSMPPEASSNTLGASLSRMVTASLI